MARRNRRSPAPDRGRAIVSHQTTADFRGVGYTVRTVSGQAATKPYRCPGCDQLVPAGTPHVVVWPYDDVDAADRRHWHTPCWGARERRRPR